VVATMAAWRAPHATPLCRRRPTGHRRDAFVQDRATPAP